MIEANILIVEDEAILALDLQNELRQWGYNVLFIVNSGEGAIQKTNEYHPDLVLMDIALEGEMDGIEVANYLIIGKSKFVK